MASDPQEPLVVRVSPVNRRSEALKAELRRVFGEGRLVTLGTKHMSPEEIIAKIRVLDPSGIVLDLATPPHTTMIRAVLADYYPILVTTVEQRRDPTTGRPGYVTAIARRTSTGDIEHLADGAVDPRRQ